MFQAIFPAGAQTQDKKAATSVGRSAFTIDNRAPAWLSSRRGRIDIMAAKQFFSLTT
jgi:hypothetical protein